MTTTDLARMGDNAVAVLDTTNDALARLADWVAAARNAHQLVAPLVGTAFIPDAYKPKTDPRATPEQRAEARDVAIANATAAVLQGITLGLDPMTALQQIYVVHGRPGMYTRIKVALVQAHGHEVWTEDLSDSRAVVCGRRRGNEGVERVTVTMEQARKAGWTSNQAYTKTPQDMLYARAAARVCDRIAADVLMGIASVEEIQDEIKTTAEVGVRTVAAPRKRAAPQAIEATTVDEPPLEAEVAANEPTAKASPQDGITAPQQKKLHALLNEKGLGNRDTGLLYITGVVGRDLETTKDLSKVEAGRVIEALEALGEEAEPALDGDNWPEAAQPGGDA